MFKSEARRIEMTDEPRSAESSPNRRLGLEEEVFEQIHHLERFTPVAFTILSEAGDGEEVAGLKIADPKAG